MIVIDNICKSFGRNSVLNGVSVKTKPGEIVAILGPNGSGKTTLIKSILGLIGYDSGEILVNENSIKGNSLYREHIGYLPQIAQFPENLKVSELLAMIRDFRQKRSEYMGLVDRFLLNEHLHKPLKNLSGGTRQKVNIVLAFMFDCPILILDEPTVGLDPVALIQLREMILEERKRGKTILLTTHITQLVKELADRIVFLLDGKVYFDGRQKELIQITGSEDLEHSIATILIENELAAKSDLEQMSYA